MGVMSTANAAKPACFTINALADRWDCDPRVVTAMIKDGRLKSFTVGARERITLTEVTRIEGEEGNHETHEDQALAALD